MVWTRSMCGMGAADSRPDWGVPEVANLDFLGRALLALVFTLYVCSNAVAIVHLVKVESWSEAVMLDVAARASAMIFMLLAVVMTVIRLPPKNTPSGWTSRFVAIGGTFVTLIIIVLPSANVPIFIKLSGTILVMTGTALSAYCLLWLGRSFSIDAQARRLVTEGPYRIVRHPLYVSEAIALAGIVLANLSAAAVAIGTLNLLLQYWRILNEERVLRQSFPEYSLYAASVPRVLPRIRTQSHLS
jgi:protein-S-isoprenylcysteine O-methyltransferase Ste14